MILKFNGFEKSGLCCGFGILTESRSEKHPHCHFERQREIFYKQDSLPLALLGMTAAEVSGIKVHIIELFRRLSLKITFLRV